MQEAQRNKALEESTKSDITRSTLFDPSYSRSLIAGYQREPIQNRTLELENQIRENQMPFTSVHPYAPGVVYGVNPAQFNNIAAMPTISYPDRSQQGLELLSNQAGGVGANGLFNAYTPKPALNPGFITLSNGKVIRKNDPTLTYPQ